LALFSLFGLHTETCGIDIGYHGIRGAQLKYPRQHAPLVALSEVQLSKKVFDKNQLADKDGLAQAIHQLVQSGQPHPITAKAVVAALPEMFIFTRVIQLPNLPPEELQMALPHEVSQYIPLPVEDVYYDHVRLALRPDKEQLDVALFAAPKVLVDDLIDAIHQNGLELYALETKATAIMRSLLPLGTTESALIIEIGSESTRMTVADHGNVWLTTSLNVGTLQLLKTLSEKLAKPEAEVKEYLAKHQSVNTESILSTAVSGIVQEAISATRYHETRDYHPTKIHRAIVVGQGTTIPGIIPAIVRSFHIKCEPGLPLVTGVANVDLKFGVALGLSMRSLS